MRGTLHPSPYTPSGLGVLGLGANSTFPFMDWTVGDGWFMGRVIWFSVFNSNSRKAVCVHLKCDSKFTAQPI